MKWIPCKDKERLPETGKVVLFDSPEKPPIWGWLNDSKVQSIVTLNSSGEEEYESLDDYEVYLDEDNADDAIEFGEWLLENTNPKSPYQWMHGISAYTTTELYNIFKHEKP